MTREQDKRFRMWNAMLKKKTFSVKSIAAAADVEYQSAFRYLERLRRDGFIAEQKKTEPPMSGRTYAMCSGLVRPPVLTQPNGRERMWKAMPPLKRFTHLDLALVASVPKTAAYYYCQALKNAGYLRLVSPGINTPAVYHLIKERFSGPKAPQIRRDKSVFDPNAGTVVFAPEGRAA